MKKYKGKLGFINNNQAKEIGEYLEEKIPEKMVTPEILLEIARPKNNLLHKYFEWNNENAAEGFRLIQARRILRCIYIEIKPGVEIRAYHHCFIEESLDNQYVSLDMAMESPQLWKQVVSKALREAEAWRERYKTYKELAPIISAINEVNKKQRENVI